MKKVKFLSKEWQEVRPYVTNGYDLGCTHKKNK